MDQELKLKWKLEAYWILATIAIAAAILYPIIIASPNYPYIWENLIFILVGISLLRYILLLKYTPLAHFLFGKLILLCVSIPLILLLIRSFNSFLTFLDEQGVQNLFENLSAKGNDHISGYIRTETIFFGTLAILLLIATPFRMLISIWWQYNSKGKV